MKILNEVAANTEVRFRPMGLIDVPTVAAIDQVSFPTPWSESTYRQEVGGNPAAHLFIVEVPAATTKAWEIAGYVGFWFIVEEAHISTIAVHPERRRQGLGRMLLKFMLERAQALGAERVKLEVRESNIAAQSLYRAFGFVIEGRRPGYYRDRDEDALVMSKQAPFMVPRIAKESVGGN